MVEVQGSPPCPPYFTWNKTGNVHTYMYTEVHHATTCSRKAISITHSECVFAALDIQHACTCDILSYVTCQALQYFFILFHKWHNFLKKGIEHKMCILTFFTTFIWNISHSNKNWARYDLHVKYQLLLSDFNWTWKILKCKIQWKSIKWELSWLMRMNRYD